MTLPRKRKVLHWKTSITHQRVQQLDDLKTSFQNNHLRTSLIFCLCYTKIRREPQLSFKSWCQPRLHACLLFLPHFPNMSLISWISSCVHQELPCFSYCNSKVSFRVFCFYKASLFLIWPLETHIPNTHTQNVNICAGKSHDMIFSLLCLTTHRHHNPWVLEAWEWNTQPDRGGEEEGNGHGPFPLQWACPGLGERLRPLLALWALLLLLLPPNSFVVVAVWNGKLGRTIHRWIQ